MRTERAASIWRPLAKSGDELASKGLKFLRAYVTGRAKKLGRVAKRGRATTGGRRRVRVR